MINWLQYLVLIFLILVSFIDLKKRTLPSPLTTSAIFVVAIVNIENLPFGILAGILGWLLTDFYKDDYSNVFSGLSDLKMTVLLGLMVSNINAFLLFTFLLVFFGVAYKIIIVKFFPKEKEIAFIPVFLIIFIVMILVEVFTNVKIF